MSDSLVQEWRGQSVKTALDSSTSYSPSCATCFSRQAPVCVLIRPFPSYFSSMVWFMVWFYPTRPLPKVSTGASSIESIRTFLPYLVVTAHHKLEVEAAFTGAVGLGIARI